jgi:hypothetical protein
MANDFKLFSGGVSANVLTQAQYEALATLISDGFLTGVAPSNAFNKVWRQASMGSSILGGLIEGVTGQSALDDGTTITLLKNLMAAIMKAGYAVDSGVVDAYAVTLSPAPLAYYPGMVVGFKTANANTTSTPTLNVNGLGAISITGVAGSALSNGQIPANSPVWVTYNSTGPRFELNNSSSGSASQPFYASQFIGNLVGNADTATTIAGTAGEKLPSLSVVQASGALTFSSVAQYRDFRSATLTTGSPTTLYAAPADLVLPSGGTLGFVSTVEATILIAEMNYGGVKELAVCRQVGGLQTDENNLISTTGIGTGSDSGDVWYSTTARTNLPYKIIGAAKVTNTGGVWGNPSLVQPAGGQALSGLGSLFQDANGYTKLTNGLILQWGTLTTTAGADTTVTYPIAFPKAVLHVSGTANLIYSTQGIVQLQGTPALSTFAVAVNNAGARIAAPIYWHAIGI